MMTLKEDLSNLVRRLAKVSAVVTLLTLILPAAPAIAQTEMTGDGGQCRGSVFPPQIILDRPSGKQFIEFGANIDCRAVRELKFTARLYWVLADTQSPVLKDTGEHSEISKSVGKYFIHQCFYDFSKRWIYSVEATANGRTFIPYPAWSSSVTLPCWFT